MRVFASFFAVTRFFAERALSLIGVRALRLPSSEKALLAGFESAFDAVFKDDVSSHGKPGGDEGGLDALVGSSEKMALSVGDGLDGTVSSDESIVATALCGPIMNRQRFSHNFVQLSSQVEDATLTRRILSFSDVIPVRSGPLPSAISRRFHMPCLPSPTTPPSSPCRPSHHAPTSFSSSKLPSAKPSCAIHMAPRISTSSRLIPITDLDPASFAPFGEVIQNPSTHNGTPKLQRVVANQGSAEKWLDVTKMRNWYELSSSRKPASVSMNMFVCKPRQLEKREGRSVFLVKILERHPFTPQTFVPLGLTAEDKGTCYLVIVAPTLPLRSRSGSIEDGGLEPAYPILPPRRKRSLRERLLGTRPNPFTNDFNPSTTSAASPSSNEPKLKGPGLPDLDNIRAFIAHGDLAVTYGPGTWHAPMVVLGEKAIDFVVVQYANGVAVEDCQEVEIQVEAGGDGLAVELDDALSQPFATTRAKL